MKLSRDALYFKQPNGEGYLLADGSPKAIYYTPDGKNFFEILVINYGGTDNYYEILVLDPHRGLLAKLTRRGDYFNSDEYRSYHLAPAPTSIKVIPVPKVHVPTKLYRFSETPFSFVYLSHEKYNFRHPSIVDESTYRLYVGLPNNMTPIKIKEVIHSDDKYKEIVTETARLFVTEPECRYQPGWNNQILVEIDPQDFTIIETEHSVKIYI